MAEVVSHLSPLVSDFVRHFHYVDYFGYISIYMNLKIYNIYSDSLVICPPGIFWAPALDNHILEVTTPAAGQREMVVICLLHQLKSQECAENRQSDTYSISGSYQESE